MNQREAQELARRMQESGESMRKAGGKMVGVGCLLTVAFVFGLILLAIVMALAGR